ncbi:MAG: ATP-dependent zinc metalloprotease FtsH, partial [Sulfurovum sp.]
DVAGLMVLKRSEHSFLGGAGAVTEYSEKMSESIDEHIKATLEEHYAYVKQTLRDYKGAIEKMTAELLDVEVIEGKTVQKIIDEYEQEHNMPSRLVHKPKTEEKSDDTSSDQSDEKREK